LDTGKYLKLLPHLHGTDGFFAAVFEKKQAVSEPNIKSASAKPIKKAT
jgi:16S rRNA (cytosine967-C5)-methyltransferase